MKYIIIIITILSLTSCAKLKEHRVCEILDYDENGTLLMKIKYQYNNGILTHNYGYDNYDNIIFIIEYIYDSNNLLIKSIMKDNNYLNSEITGQYDFISTYEYDNNKLIKTIYWLKNGEKINYSIIYYEIDKINKIETYNFTDEILYIIYFEYDIYGRRIKTFDENNELLSYREYNENNLLNNVVFNNGKYRIFIWENGISRYNQDLFSHF